MTASSEDNRRVVCVFCGSSPGNSPAHVAAARALAEAFHRENVKLVYGGGTRGIMGEIAHRLVELSGPRAVHGIIPHALVKVEEGYKNGNGNGNDKTDGGDGAAGPGKAAERVVSTGEQTVNEEYGVTTLVPDMHTRKRLMAKEVINGGPGSGFIVLPGGFGTLEEAMEMTTWNQLAIHHRGIVLLNIEGYYDGILQWVQKSVDEGFVSAANQSILVECKEPEDALEALDKYRVSDGRYMLDWGVQHG